MSRGKEVKELRERMGMNRREFSGGTYETAEIIEFNKAGN